MIAKKSGKIRLANTGTFQARKSPGHLRMSNNHKFRDMAMFILKLIVILICIFAIFRHRIFRLR